MSALWRINLWVCGFFALVTLACMALLVHQALEDVARELQSAEAVVDFTHSSVGGRVIFSQVIGQPMRPSMLAS